MVNIERTLVAMGNNIFRQKNIDKINSPESLNDYVKVTNPSVWIILIGVVVLIAGAMVFGMIGEIDTNVYAAIEVTDGVATAYVDEAYIDKVKAGMCVKVNEIDCTINNISDRPLQSSEVDRYVLHRGNMESSQWIYPITVDGALEEGVYPATITVESVAPVSYVFN